MTFRPEQIAALKAPLFQGVVKQRKAGNGMTLSYVEAWHAIAEANRIFGFDAWNRETVELRLLGEPRLTGDKWRVGYMAKVRITVGAIVREGCGFGSGIDKDVDQAHESALKEAESDAMKRALMTFGNPFGLALYDKTQAAVTSEKPVEYNPDDYNPDNPPPGPPIGDRVMGRKSSAQAKRDGDDVKIKSEISTCDKAGLRDWHENFDSYTAHIPFSWLDSIRDMLEHRLEELNGAANIAEAEAELDDSFRGAVGGSGSSRLPRSNSHVAGAQA